MSIYERSEDHAVCKVCGQIDCYECKPNKENKVMITTTKLAGVTANPTCKKNIQELKEGMTLDLRSYRFERGDYVDAHAVEVLNGDKPVGHIPAKNGVNRLFHNNPTTQCRVTNVIRKAGEATSKDFEEGGFTNDTSVPVVAVEIEADLVVAKEETLSASLGWDKPDEEFELKKSFNEDVEVEFYPESHQYWLGDVKLQSVTRMVSECFDPFDAKRIAGFCENKYNMKADDIAKWWKKLGNASALVGSGIHEFIELYEMTGHNDNFLPKMPYLRDVITSFPWEDGATVHVECLVTDIKNKKCGLADRLVERDGVYTVEDMKINYGAFEIKPIHASKVFDGLPNNKTGKYCVQLSAYADMLERSGLRVSNEVIAHIFDGVWTLHKMGRILNVVELIIDKLKVV